MFVMMLKFIIPKQIYMKNKGAKGCWIYHVDEQPKTSIQTFQESLKHINSILVPKLTSLSICKGTHCHTPSKSFLDGNPFRNFSPSSHLTIEMFYSFSLKNVSYD